MDNSVNSPGSAGTRLCGFDPAGTAGTPSAAPALSRQRQQKKASAMLVDVTWSEGDTTVLERIDAPVDLEGSGAQEGVPVNFPFEGREVTGRITRVLAPTVDQPDTGPAIEVALVDRDMLDVESDIALAKLPPRKDDFGTEL